MHNLYANHELLVKDMKKIIKNQNKAKNIFMTKLMLKDERSMIGI